MPLKKPREIELKNKKHFIGDSSFLESYLEGWKKHDQATVMSAFRLAKKRNALLTIFPEAVGVFKIAITPIVKFNPEADPIDRRYRQPYFLSKTPGVIHKRERDYFTFGSEDLLQMLPSQYQPTPKRGRPRKDKDEPRKKIATTKTKD